MATGPAAIVYKHFENLTDPRSNRGKNHSLVEMIFLALTATICGAQGWADVERFARSKRAWFRRFVRLKQGIPSHDTFGRVFAVLDTGEFLTAMHAWVDAFAGSLRGQGIAIDGKTLRGSFDRAAGKSALHTITAFSCDMRICLRQMSVGEKSNEIPAVPQLLKLMELSGATVTLDAMHCQVETARAILAAEADYILIVKGNQEVSVHHCHLGAGRRGAKVGCSICSGRVRPDQDLTNPEAKAMSNRQDVQKRRVWAERLKTQRASGLSVVRFCASQRVSVNTFYYWSKRLRTDSTAASSTRTPSRPGSSAAELGQEPARHSQAAAGTEQPALVRFRFNEAVEISVPADCLEAIRCLAQCAQQARVESAGAFQEVVVARR